MHCVTFICIETHNLSSLISESVLDKTSIYFVCYREINIKQVSGKEEVVMTLIMRTRDSINFELYTYSLSVHFYSKVRKMRQFSSVRVRKLNRFSKY